MFLCCFLPLGIILSSAYRIETNGAVIFIDQIILPVSYQLQVPEVPFYPIC